MKIIKNILNYLIWWLTGIVGWAVLLVFGILCVVGHSFRFFGEVFWFIITAPIDNNFHVIDPIEREVIWVNNTMKYIWRFIGSKPF